MFKKDSWVPRADDEGQTPFASVTQTAEEHGAGEPRFGGGAGRAFLFRSTPALSLLKIPERRPRAETPAFTAAAAAPAARSYRWPVAFVLAAGIATAGVVFMRQSRSTAPDATTPAAPAAATSSAASAATANDPGAAQDEHAAATGSDPQAAASATGASATADEGAAAAPSVAAAGAVSDKSSRARRADGTAREAKPGKTAAEATAAAKDPAASTAATGAAPTGATPATGAAAKGKASGLDSLIDDAMGAADAPAKPAAATAKATPAAEQGVDDEGGSSEQLSMNQIREGMVKVRGLVQSCFDKYQVEGKATVKLTITPDGGVTGPSIKGKFFGTDTGNCVLEAVGKAKFTAFKGKPMTISYPFLLQ